MIEKPFIPEANEFTKHNDKIFAGHLYFKRKEKKDTFSVFSSRRFTILGLTFNSEIFLS